MRIAVMAASTQAARGSLLYTLTCEAAPEDTVVYLGCTEEEEGCSYLDIAVEAGILLGSGAADFVVTGCSSGQGMMLACNSMPGVCCGYLPTPQDAYLFGRINAGNAASLPLGLGFGWSGELNLRYTLKALFEGEMGTGYPPEDAMRKRRDTERLKKLGTVNGFTTTDFLRRADKELLGKALERKCFTDYILREGRNTEVSDALRERMRG